MKFFIVFYLTLLTIKGAAQQTPFEKSDGKRSATYQEVISFYQILSARSQFMQYRSEGETDAGYPLSLLLISGDRIFDPAKWHQNGKVVILIMNGIHPGEPDGIDASMMLARNIADRTSSLPANVAIAIIPIYNIGGALNRNSFSRVNQNGPEAYGFRGNAQNLDLNRDFIKCDSRNARSFATIFHLLNPHVMVDTHVSDGADYQHTISLITTQYDKLGKPLSIFLKNEFEPALFKGMKAKGWDLVPYLNVDNADPANGFSQFYDAPRYSSGYAALFNTISFMPETHMLKPFKDRVNATYDMLNTFIEKAAQFGDRITKLKKQADEQTKELKYHSLSWKPDTTTFSNILFKGYQATTRPSELTNTPVLFFNHEKPFTKPIKFFDHYIPVKKILPPAAYIIPQGWWKVIDPMKLNKINMSRLEKDSVIHVTSYKIGSYSSLPTPYESHHKNFSIKVISDKQEINFRKGDYIIPVNQPGNKYIIETLEPESEDGFFTWNFFDAILQQKEYFSEYRWDSMASRYYDKHIEIKDEFNGKMGADSSFRQAPAMQLDFIYRKSPHFEKEYMKYPVYRIER